MARRLQRSRMMAASRWMTAPTVTCGSARISLLVAVMEAFLWWTMGGWADSSAHGRDFYRSSWAFLSPALLWEALPGGVAGFFAAPAAWLLPPRRAPARGPPALPMGVALRPPQ